MLQPWMRKEVLTKFGRTTANKWQPQSNELNPFRDYSREDIDPLPIKKRIRYWKLARGDRVRVVKGEHKGKEGIIKAIDNTRNQVIVDGLNTVRSRISENIKLDRDPVGETKAYPLEYSDLRLVWELPSSYRTKWAEIAKEPLLKPEVHPDGKWRVLIEKLKIGRRYVDMKTKRQSFHRIIPGLNISVPWPKRPREPFKEEHGPGRFSDRAYKYPNTPAEIVHKTTFTSAPLVYPPLPPGIEFELHNPYSRFKRLKFGRAIAQMTEYRRRHEPGFAEQERVKKVAEEKAQNVYTSEQLRIRAANKLVKKARKTYLKRKKLTDADIQLIASYVKSHIQSKMAKLLALEREVQPLTALEQGMSVKQRLAHRAKSAILDKEALEKRKEVAEMQAKARVKAVQVAQGKGRFKTFEFKPSERLPDRKMQKRKKKKKKPAPMPMPG